MRFGASKVALLTTDSYRIGAHEQLRIFGKILGVSVHVVNDGDDLHRRFPTCATSTSCSSTRSA